MIRRAKIQEIPEIMAVTKACAKHMQKKGIYQWNDAYPSKEAFVSDISRRELYVYIFRKKIIGFIVVTPLIDEEYLPVKWLTETANNVYIHRLAVHPEHQAKGFAQELMSFAESLAREKNYDSIRLDTFSKNLRNQRFYEQRGYQRLGDVYFPNQSQDPFHCYELIL